MKPAPFAYHAPDTLDETLALLAEHAWEARPLAGGQSLIPAMNFRLAQPTVLVDLGRVEELVGIADTAEGGLRIGAMTRQREVERSDLVKRRAPLLHRAMPWVAHPQIRNRGTLGGSLAHADPAAELPAVALVGDARFHVAGADGTRVVPAAEFYLGLMATALMPGELLTAVELPPPGERTGHAFVEMARRHGDYAIVGVAATVALDGEGACSDARVGLLSVGETPLRFDLERLRGETPNDDLLAEAAAEVAEALDPPSDLHASSAYRRHLARVLVGRALKAAFGDAAQTDKESA